MEEIRRALSALFAMTVLHTALDAALPEGAVKRTFKFVFSLAMMAVMMGPVFALARFMMEMGR